MRDALPAEWPIVRLEDVAVIFDCPHSTPQLTSSGPLVARSQDVRTGIFRTDLAAHVSEDTYRERVRRAEPRYGDLLFSREGTYFGIAADVPRGVRVCLGQRMVLIRPSGRINSRFLRFWLNSSMMGEYASGFHDGSVAQRLNVSTIRALPVPLPNEDEQHGIANLLGALDDKTALNGRMNHTLESTAAALFGKWRRDSESSSSPVRAEELIARGILLINDGYRAKNLEMAESGLPFARAGNLQRHFDFSGADLLGDAGVRAAREKVSQAFDCVFTSKGTVGRIAQVLPSTPRFVYSPQLCFWRSLRHDDLNPFVLSQWMNGEEFREQVDAVKGQTDMADYVSLRDQRRMMITLPLSADQTVIGARLESLARLQDANMAESRTLASLRDTLLPQLLSGVVRLRHAERLVEFVA
jgi:type I restriction enzyme S subunit